MVYPSFKGSSLHSFVYPLASVRVVWLRCGLKWRDFCINVKALTQKGSPFLRPPKGDTVHEAGKEHLGTVPRGVGPVKIYAQIYLQAPAE